MPEVKINGLSILLDQRDVARVLAQSWSVEQSPRLTIRTNAIIGTKKRKTTLARFIIGLDSDGMSFTKIAKIHSIFEDEI